MADHEAKSPFRARIGHPTSSSASVVSLIASGQSEARVRPSEILVRAVVLRNERERGEGWVMISRGKDSDHVPSRLQLTSPVSTGSMKASPI